MKPEVQKHLEKARQDLADARKLASLGMIKIAARSAYFAAFPAAEAYIFEHTGKVAKTHSGVRTELARLLKGAPVAGEPLPGLLARSYKYKEISDYGNTDDVVSEAEMRAAIEGAEHFIVQIVALLQP